MSNLLRCYRVSNSVASLLSSLELSHVLQYAPSFSLSAPCILLTLTHRLRFISNPYFDIPSSEPEEIRTPIVRTGI